MPDIAKLEQGGAAEDPRARVLIEMIAMIGSQQLAKVICISVP